MNEDFKETTEYQAGRTIINEGIAIRIPFIFKSKLRLVIKPLRSGTIARLSMQVMKLKKIEKHGVPEFVEVGINYKVFAKMIAIAVMNNKLPKRFLTNLLARIILWKTKPEDILAYVQVAYRQMDHEVFFYTMVAAMGMNYLEKKINLEKSVGAKRSGAQ